MRRGRPFYGWINVGALWLSYMLTLTPFTYAFGIIVSEMAGDLGLSMTLASGGYTCYALFSSLSAPLAGRLIDRAGPKRTILFGCAVCALGAFLMSRWVAGVLAYYLVWVLLFSVGIRCGSLMPAQVCLSRWFFQKRGLAMAIVLTSGGVGGYIFTPLLRAVSEAHGWRGVWLLIAACNVLALLVTGLVLRDDPARMGLAVDNGLPLPEAPAGGAQAKTREPWTLRMAVREPVFYGLVLVFFTASYQMIAVGNYAINHLSLRGVPAAAAASAVGYFAIINTLGRLAVGFLSERISIKHIMLAGSAVALAGNALMLRAGSAPAAYTALVCCGIGYGVLMVAPQTLLVDYFGATNYASINGGYGMLSGILSSLPSVIIGALYDATGSYAWAWRLAMALLAGCLLVSVFSKPPVFKADRPRAAAMPAGDR